MGKKTKTGKTRLDKGFRSRAAFKLIQLNKKYDFLSNAQSIIDLCAAPGGWMQVASKFTPNTCKIIGFDLFPIRPVPKCKSFAQDITSQQCRNTIKSEFPSAKVDLVVHDGAPNVGKQWDQDAYLQCELVLHAAKLAVEFLRPNGTFVTKVFRSKDYPSLIYVLQQFFRRVEATKPQASRTTSAEIFVVCSGFLSPKKYDNRLFDAKFAFKDVVGDEPEHVDVLAKKQPKRHRTGYEDGIGVKLYKEIPVSQFIDTTEPIKALECHAIVAPPGDTRCQLIMDHPSTTPEIKACLADVKVLSRGDLKMLLRWRLRMIKAFAKIETDKKPVDSSSDEESEASDDDDDHNPKSKGKELKEMDKEYEALMGQLTDAQKSDLKKQKRQKRKDRKLLSKRQRAIDSGQVLAGDRIEVADDDGTLFRAKGDATGTHKVRVQNDGEFEGSESGDDDDDEEERPVDYYISDDDISEDDDQDEQPEKDRLSIALAAEMGSGAGKERNDEELERMLDDAYAQYKERLAKRQVSMLQAARDKAKILPDGTIKTKRNAMDAIDTLFDSVEKEMDKKPARHDDSDSDSDDNDDQDQAKDTGLSASAAKFFDQPLFKQTMLDDQEISARKAVDEAEKARDVTKKKRVIHAEKDSLFDENRKARKKSKKVDEDDLQVVPAEHEREHSDIGDHIIHMALATQMANDPEKRQEIEDWSYNRYSFMETEDELPRWFLEDEIRHNKPQVPVTKEIVDMIKARFIDINAKPIRKVAEAKFRKKKRLDTKLAQLKQRLAGIVDSDELDPRAKARAVEKEEKKFRAKAKPRKTELLVVHKFQASDKRLGARASARKGGAKVKLVDARMKKDLKNAQAAKKGKSKGGFHRHG